MFSLFRIALRQLRKKHKYGLINLTSYISIVGLSLGISALLIVYSFTNGFSKAIEDKLTSIDGHLRISKYNKSLNQNISKIEFNFLDSTINNIYNTKSIVPYIEGNGIIGKNSIMEGAYIYGVENNNSIDAFNLNNIIQEGEIAFNDNNQIIIGDKLADNLNVKIGENIILFNMLSIIDDGIFEANSLEVIGIIKTGFPEYDKILAFIPISTAMKIFLKQDNYSGLIITLSNINEITSLLNILENNSDLFPYLISSWKERHVTLFTWLQSYHIPIKIIVIFIIILATCNIGVTLWMLVLEKRREIGVLKTIGYNKKMIAKIYIYQGIIIGIIGSIFGTIFGLFIILMQNKFHFIRLSDEVYFINYLPAIINWYQVIITGILSIVLSIIMSIIPARRAINISPIESIQYE